MALHRLLTIAMAVLLVFHLIDVGIGLPQRFFDSQEMKAPTVSVLEKETSVLTPTPTPTPTSSPTPSPAPSPIPESPESASDATPSPTETVQPESSFNSAMEMPEITEESSGNGLSDGVYEGTAAGRNGPITVRVTVEAGTISYIEVLSQSETPKYYARAEEVIPSILAAGSPDVDSITGATLSSEGIKAAVANALGY